MHLPRTAGALLLCCAMLRAIGAANTLPEQVHIAVGESSQVSLQYQLKNSLRTIAKCNCQRRASTPPTAEW